MHYTLCFFLRLVCQPVNEPRGEETQCNAQHKAAQHIGGEVHIQVQPGKGDESRQHQRGDAQLPVLQPERKGCRKSRGRVPGGEGVPVGTLDQNGDRRVHVAGAGPGEQRLEDAVPGHQIQYQRRGHGAPGLAGAAEQQQKQRERDPELTVLTGVVEKDGQRIQHRVVELLQPVQKCEFKRHKEPPVCWFYGNTSSGPPQPGRQKTGVQK